VGPDHHLGDVRLLASRDRKWLYLIAGSLAFAYISMESAFIFCIIFGAFAAVVTLIELSKQKDFWAASSVGRYWTGCRRIDRHRRGDRANVHHGRDRTGAWRCDAVSAAPQPLQPGLAIEFSAQLMYWIQMLGGTAKLLLFTLVPAWPSAWGCITGSIHSAGAAA